MIPDLLARAGFVDVRGTDVTGEYHATTHAWLAARLRHRDAVRPLDPAMFDERIAKNRAALAAIEAGLLRRTMYAARADPATPCVFPLPWSAPASDSGQGGEPGGTVPVGRVGLEPTTQGL